MKRPLLLFFLFCLFLLPAAAGAETAEPPGDAPPAADQGPPEPELHFPGIGGLTVFHTYVSNNVENLSRRLDAFFSTNLAYEESSGTYVLLRGSSIYSRGGEIDYDGTVRAHLELPRFKKRLSLLIQSIQADAPSENAPTTGTNLPDAINDQSLAATLQYIVQRKEYWDVRLQPGAKFNWPPEPYVRLRCRWLHPLNPTWLSRAIFTPGWFTEQGWEARLRWDLERTTGNEALFRSSSQLVWLLDEPHNVDWTEVLFFVHPLGSSAQVAYEAGINGVLEPAFEENYYYASIRYRSDVHHGWIFFELRPQIDFARDDDFKPNPSIALTLEMLFGARYL